MSRIRIKLHTQQASPSIIVTYMFLGSVGINLQIPRNTTMQETHDPQVTAAGVVLFFELCMVVLEKWFVYLVAQAICKESRLPWQCDVRL